MAKDKAVMAAMTDEKNTSSLMYIDELIPKFSGQDKSYPAARFVQDLDDNSEIFRWSAIQQLIVARRSLTGTAALWLKSEKPFKTWDELKASLLKEFPDNIDSKVIHEMMSTRRKKKDESCLDYILVMKELGRRGKMADYVAIKYIVDGIQDLETNKIMLYGVTTYTDLKEKIKIYETLKEKMKTTTSQSVPNRSFKQKVGRKCFNCGGNNHESRECPHKQRGLKCFSCGQFGHIASSCNMDSARASSNHQKTDKKNYNQMCVEVSKQSYEQSSLETETDMNEHLDRRNMNNSNGKRRTENSSHSLSADNIHSDHSIRSLENVKMADFVDKKSSMNVNNNLQNISKSLKEIMIDGKSVNALIDSGSDVNIISTDCEHLFSAREFFDKQIILTGLGYNKIISPGYVNLDIVIDNKCFNSVLFHIVDKEVMSFSVILGQEFLCNVNVLMKGSQIKFLDDDCWLRNYACGVCESNVSDYVANPAIREEVKSIVETYQPNKTLDAPIQLKIILKDDIPVAQRPRRLAVTEQEEVDRQVNQWIQDGIVRVSFSEYASPLVLVKKKDGTTRICVDYRAINRKMVKDEYPLPVIEDQIDKLCQAKVFSTIDLKNGYFHLPVHKDSIKYTAFVTHSGLFEFLKAPFGIAVCPKVFTRFINIIFRDFVAKGYIQIFIDDVVIISENESQAVERLKEVLHRASQHGLEINWEKSQLIQRRVQYLGHVIENGTVRPSPEKTDAVVRYPTPTTIKQLHSFIGLTSYFRKFIPNYALIAKPLTDLLKKNENFRFEESHQKAFDELRLKLASSPVLKIYNPKLETELHTDASMTALAAVLLQRDPIDGLLHPIYYMSRKTSDSQQKYTSYELEALAIIEGVKKFRQYLYGKKFKIITDCQAFELTLKKKDLSTRVARWVMFLQEYDYEVEHRTGTLMRHVDALSRAPYVGVITRDLHDKIKQAQMTDESLMAIFEVLKEKPYLDYGIENGVLWKGNQLVIPKTMEMEMIKRVHQNGHFSKKKMSDLISRDYYITDLSKKIDEFILTCVPCLLATKKCGKQEGFLNAIEKEGVPLHTLHIDHIGPLSETKKLYNYILTIVDAFTKFVWIFPTKTTTAKETIDKLKIHQQTWGNALRVITDRGAAFTSNDFREFCEAENIQHVLITTGVPRGNGQVERIHRTIISVLTKLCIADPGLWFKHISRLQVALNSTYQRSIATTPFELMIGTKMRSKEDIHIYDMLLQEDRDAYVIERENLRVTAKAQILKVQKENEKTFNRKRKPSTLYKVGDWVAIMRTQYGKCLKLKPKFLGPYRVIAVNGRDRYHVEKLDNSTEGPIKTSTAADYMKPWPKH